MASRHSLDRAGLGVNELPTVVAPSQLNRVPSEQGSGSHSASDDKAHHSAHDMEHDKDGAGRDLETANVVDRLEQPEQGSFQEKMQMVLHSKPFVIFRDFLMIGIILGWWICAIINKNVRHRWIPSTVIAWFFILLILLHNSRYIPQRPIVRVIDATWTTCAVKPWSRISHKIQVAIGWVLLAILIFGSTYGLPVSETSNRANRTISLVGLLVIYIIFFLMSNNKRKASARPIILGLGLQFVIALFVFRTGAGYSLFRWIAIAASDLLSQAQAPTGAYASAGGGGAAFFWSADFVGNHYFFVNILSSIIFFVAICVALYYLGVLSWCIKKAAWGAYKLFGISGAEAVVAVASPFIGQGENAILVRPFVKTFTRSEFHQALTSGFATIAGSVFIAYVELGVSGKDLITSSVMSIPASIAASKLVYPETEEPDTVGRVVIDRQEADEEKASGFFEALSNGASFGLTVAWLIFCNVLVVVSVLTTVNGILAWIGNAIYITDANGPLTLQLILGYILWPLTFLLGVPSGDCLNVSKLIAIKVIANEFVGYNTLETSTKALLSPRAYLIAKYCLCGFGNIGSMGIQLGIMRSMAPNRSKDITKVIGSALITGILVTLSSAAIAGIVGLPTDAATDS